MPKASVQPTFGIGSKIVLTMRSISRHYTTKSAQYHVRIFVDHVIYQRQTDGGEQAAP